MKKITSIVLLLAQTLLAQPTTAPATIDPALQQRMAEVDSRSAKIQDVVADFQQEKFTAMLKKPLVSKGTVRATTSTMLWDTTSPQPTVMRISPTQASIYYPKEKLLEEYPIAGQLGALAASPLPRVDTLKQHFRFESDSAKSLDPAADDVKFLAVKMIPIDASISEHVKQVRVLLDVATGLMMRVEITDADGDRTVMSFSNTKTNTGLTDAQLSIRTAPDVKVSRPLEKLAPAADSSGRNSRP